MKPQHTHKYIGVLDQSRFHALAQRPRRQTADEQSKTVKDH